MLKMTKRYFVWFLRVNSFGRFKCCKTKINCSMKITHSQSKNSTSSWLKSSCIVALIMFYFLVVFHIKKQPLSSFKCDIQYEYGKPVRVTTHGDLNPKLARSLRRKFIQRTLELQGIVGRSTSIEKISDVG